MMVNGTNMTVNGQLAIPVVAHTFMYNGTLVKMYDDKVVIKGVTSTLVNNTVTLSNGMKITKSA
jgi:hypothetical protein